MMKEYDPAIGKQIINLIRLKTDGTVSVIFFGIPNQGKVMF